ncbi:hypothetical protein N3K66_001650 [Trichothecium roseum]|uniref:Uncharacterized protein n=1 Tax=Trichothecium roseum TaxID=47278 RepID=A0ACC0V955_9HYPO|nr:hypothetical protein N3K66_001650 [Trichothecium roseum]
MADMVFRVSDQGLCPTIDHTLNLAVPARDRTSQAPASRSDTDLATMCRTGHPLTCQPGRHAPAAVHAGIKRRKESVIQGHLSHPEAVEDSESTMPNFARRYGCDGLDNDEEPLAGHLGLCYHGKYKNRIK